MEDVAKVVKDHGLSFSHFSKAKFQQQQKDRKSSKKFPPARGPPRGIGIGRGGGGRGRGRGRGRGGSRGRGGRGAFPPPRGPPRGPQKLPPPPPFQSFPLSQDLIFNPSTAWPHHSGHVLLPDDLTFQQAFCSLEEADCPSSWRPITRQRLFEMPKWKQKKLLEALQKQPYVLYTFPHHEIQGIPINQINWDEQDIVGVQKSNDGTIGVFFVELPGKRGAVLKFPNNPCPEVYGERMCKQSTICAPSTCLVSRASELGLSILRAYLRYQVKTAKSTTDWWANTSINITKAFCHDFFILMEYVPGAVLETRGPTTANDDWLKSVATSKATLQSIGLLIALDMVINNLDRVRTVRTWPESNPGNIYLNKIGTAVAIDSAAAWGSFTGGEGANEESFDKRMDEIKNLLLSVVEFPTVPHPAFNNVRTLLNTGLSETVIGTKMWKDESIKTTINEYHEDETGKVYLVEVELEKKTDVAEVAGWPGLGVDIGDAGVIEVQNGFVDCVKRFVELPLEIFENEIENINRLIRTEMIVDKIQWENIVSEMYKEVDPEGTLFKEFSQEMGMEDERRLMGWIAQTSTSAVGCDACGARRCQRVVDVWREVLGGGGR